jgi:uncharacterized protein YjbJ (UPF0337 family)
MRWNHIQRSWMQLRPKAKRHWVELTEAQLDVINGNRELLADSLQASYGLPRDAADEEIDKWCMTFGDEELKRGEWVSQPERKTA